MPVSVLRVTIKGTHCTTKEKDCFPLQNSKQIQKVKGKGKAIPLQAWTDPEGYRRFRHPDFKTIGIWMW